VRLEEGFLVRDCQWHPRYGWRPVQRPEDMDYLVVATTHCREGEYTEEFQPRWKKYIRKAKR
jgi:hypothetical protein